MVRPMLRAKVAGSASKAFTSAAPAPGPSSLRLGAGVAVHGMGVSREPGCRKVRAVDAAPAPARVVDLCGQAACRRRGRSGTPGRARGDGGWPDFVAWGGALTDPSRVTPALSRGPASVVVRSGLLLAGWEEAGPRVRPGVTAGGVDGLSIRRDIHPDSSRPLLFRKSSPTPAVTPAHAGAHPEVSPSASSRAFCVCGTISG